MISILELAFLLCVAVGCGIPTVSSIEEFPEPQTVVSQSISRDFDLAAVQAEFDDLMLGDASTAPMMCQPTGTCGFLVAPVEYTDLVTHPGAVYPFHRRCFCPEGTTCVKTGSNMVMQWYRYTCEVVPTGFDSLDAVHHQDVRRLGSFSDHLEL